MRLRIILAVSLLLSVALNAALVGYGYTLYRIRPLALLSDPIPPQMLEALSSRLPGGADQFLSERLEANRPELEAERAGYRSALERAAGLIEADVVDTDAVKAAIAEARTYRSRMGDVYVDTFVEMIAALPQAQRQKMVERFRKR
ncbi:periplasmic heavy metal sensor [Pleomorphomonas sp. JP5]|uniref:periplasmic heavy metal sensor n=1 Tax=Pleomorphomonas sp. JP5 TaxID=2942998 RepID=UPI002043F356|nr:periplasmic heavy metal sensor [Pleomorphomonas sp. JP5]MCM5557690.1 periplasmic heavy metal sensor [Pleomorphomonas sp. JP5]